MIAKLKGRVDSTGDTWAIIDVQGVGYQISCSRRTLASLPDAGEATTVYTEMVVRQDMIQLYGFADAHERDWFNLLTTVQGVGMKVGLAILSALSQSELSQALFTQDTAMISRAEGVGPKLAARIVNELKDKQPKGDFSSAKVVHLHSPASEMHEAISALMNLGYKRQEAIEAVSQACQNKEELPPLEEIIRQGLSKLARA